MWTIFCAIKRSWSEHFVTQFSAFLILFLTYTAVLFIGLSLENIQKVFYQWGSVSQMTVYLKPQTNESQKNEILARLKDHNLVKSVAVISSEESAQKFNLRFEKLSKKKIDSKNMAHLFPEYFEVHLVEKQAFKDESVLKTFSGELSSTFTAISQISYGESWLSSYSRLLAMIKIVGWFLIGLFMLGSMIVSASVIKSILYHRKDEIEVLEFIGASESFIYRPQLFNLMTLGLLAFSFAVIMSYSLFIAFKKISISNMALNGSEGFKFLSVSTFGIIFTLSMSLLFIETLLTIYRMMPKYKRALFVFAKARS